MQYFVAMTEIQATKQLKEKQFGVERIDAVAVQFLHVLTEISFDEFEHEG